MFSKKDMVIGIVLVIALVIGIGFITTKISNKEAEGSREYKDWKKHTTVIKGKVTDIVKQGKQQGILIQTKDDKQFVSVKQGKYQKGEAVKFRIYKSNGKLIKDLNKESDITNEKAFKKYQQSQQPQWEDINKLYGN